MMKKIAVFAATAALMAASTASDDVVTPGTRLFDFELDTRYCTETTFTGFDFNSDGLFRGISISFR